MVPTDMHILQLLPLSTNRIPIRERELPAKDKKTNRDGFLKIGALGDQLQ